MMTKCDREANKYFNEIFPSFFLPIQTSLETQKIISISCHLKENTLNGS